MVYIPVVMISAHLCFKPLLVSFLKISLIIHTLFFKNRKDKKLATNRNTNVELFSCLSYALQTMLRSMLTFQVMFHAIC